MALFVKKAPADLWWKSVHSGSDAVDRQIRSSISQTVNELRKSTLGKVEQALRSDNVRHAVDGIDWLGFQDDLQNKLESQMLKAARQTGVQTARRLGLPFDPNARRLVGPIERRAARAAQFITQESRDAARLAIRRMTSQGLTPRQITNNLRFMLGTTQRQTNSLLRRLSRDLEEGIGGRLRAKRLKQMGNRFLKSRGAGIARFEALGAAQRAQDGYVREAWRRGMITKPQKRWVTIRRGSCPICRRLHGKRVDIDKKFLDRRTRKKYMRPPEPHIHCRCGLHFFFKRKRGRRIA